MLFRSELRNTRTDQTDYLLEAALDAFGGIPGQPEADSYNAVLEFAGREEDEPTGSTILPLGSEGSPNRETPSSVPEGDQLNEREEIESTGLRSEALHRTSSSVKSNACPYGEQQPPSEEAKTVDPCNPTNGLDTRGSEVMSKGNVQAYCALQLYDLALPGQLRAA